MLLPRDQPVFPDLDRVPEGLRVEVYWNLHKRLYSVRALENYGDHIKKGRVIDHSYYLELDDVKFAVQPAGRERVRREGVKNVHAFVRGRVRQYDRKDLDNPVFITYNPYKYDSFVTAEDKTPIYRSNRVFMDTMLGNGKAYPVMVTSLTT